MAERTADVQTHWTRPDVLARIDAALIELGHDPQNLNPEILATLDHLHSGGLATTRDQAKRIAVTEDNQIAVIPMPHSRIFRSESHFRAIDLHAVARTSRIGGLDHEHR
jgi:hypothetical protein